VYVCVILSHAGEGGQGEAVILGQDNATRTCDEAVRINTLFYNHCSCQRGLKIMRFVKTIQTVA